MKVVTTDTQAMAFFLDFAEPALPQSVSVPWPGGRIEWGARSPTEFVESRVLARDPMLLMTLDGGARRVRQRTADGLTYEGPDVAGSFTFLPAGCSRELQIRAVAWRWAIVTLPAEACMASWRALHGRRDPLLRELVFGMCAAAGDTPDLAYLETAAAMAAHHLRRRQAGASSAGPKPAMLNKRQMRLLDDFVAEHLAEPLRIADLARLLGLSTGHFHRRFVATTGVTPLSWIVEKRVAAAKPLLADLELSVLDVALAVGIANPSRFAQQFRRVAGLSPRAYRRAFLDR